MPDDKPNEVGAGGEAAADAAAGGLKAWLPLIITIVAMPALAYATTSFVLLPKLEKAIGTPQEGGKTKPPKASSAGQGESDAAGNGASAAADANVLKYRIPKMIVNVSGTMGTRYLMTSLTLVGRKDGFADVVAENEDRLKDLAASTLESKTISDLERPGARNQIRTELLSVMNNALGNEAVSEIYITEMAIQ